MMLLCKDREVSAPNLRTYFKVRSYASKVCNKNMFVCNKNMFVLITDEKKDDGSIEGNVVLNTGC